MAQMFLKFYCLRCGKAGFFPDYPIIATGGADEQSIRATIRAGANAIVWTPPSSAELFRDVMKNYREGKPHP